MHLSADATLTSIKTVRAKRDSQGVVTEEPGLLLSFQIPVSVLSVAKLGLLLRAVDHDVELAVTDAQTTFGLSEDGRALEAEAVGAGR